MKPKMPWTRLNFEDFKRGCEDLTNEQIGAYLRILFEIYAAWARLIFQIGS